MSDNGQRYIYAGHAIGAAAQFDRLDPDPKKKLAHPIVIPTLGGSVLSTIGGVSKSQVSDFCFSIDEPKRETLLSVRRIESTAKGVERDGVFETEVESDIQAITFVEMLRVDFLRLHMLSARKSSDSPKITTRGNKIEGVHLGAVQARITLDDEPLCHAGSVDQLAAFYRAQSEGYRRDFAWRFNLPSGAKELAPSNGSCQCTLVREIKLSGPEDQVSKIKVEGNKITWPGFGAIFVAEISVKYDSRRLTLLRLNMGSPAAGPANAGDGSSNGQLGGG